MLLGGLYLTSAAHCVVEFCYSSDLPAVAKKGSLKCQHHSAFSASLSLSPADV